MSLNDMLLLGAAGVAAFFLLTDEGKAMLSDLIEETPAIELGPPGYDTEDIENG